MCEAHPIQPSSKPQRSYRVLLRAMPYGRVMHEAQLGAALLAAGWGAASVAMMLVRDLIASR